MGEAGIPARELVLAFYEASLNEKDVDKARSFLGDTYIQHNPAIPDGPEAFLRFVRFRRDNFPESHSEIKMVSLKATWSLFASTRYWCLGQHIPEQLFPPINDTGCSERNCAEPEPRSPATRTARYNGRRPASQEP